MGQYTEHEHKSTSEKKPISEAAGDEDEAIRVSNVQLRKAKDIRHTTMLRQGVQFPESYITRDTNPG